MKSTLPAFCLLCVAPLFAADPPPVVKPAEPPAAAAVAAAAAAKTTIRSNGLFAFEMPGAWTVMEGKKVDLGNGKSMYPGQAKGPALALTFFAFEDAKTKTSQADLKELPWVVVQPLHDKLMRSGGKEESRSIVALNEGNADQVYFSYVLAGPNGEKMIFSGIVLRTAKRLYVIHAVEKKEVTEVKVWREVAKSFKEV